MLTNQNAGRMLRQLFDAALAAALPDKCLPPYLARIALPKGRTVVVGAGKAAATMARAVDQNWRGELAGLVVTRYGHAVPTQRIEVVEAAHPVPDAAGRNAAQRILKLVGGLSAEDLVLCLISGGGSALLTLPAPGLSLEDKQSVNRALLTSGAPIGDMNVVRKHLSAIKGGRLAAAASPVRLETFAISDVPGDDPAIIASGPTVPDPSSFADALTILRRFKIDPPQTVLAHLHAGIDGRIEETPKPGDRRLVGNNLHMIATPRLCLEAAAAMARQAGYEVEILGDALEGEARELGAEQARLALQGAARGKTRLILLSGGETTVTVRGKGRGGRNVEFLLGLTLQLEGAPGIHALAADTDGIDGTEDNAGALTHPDSLARARSRGLDARRLLDANDAYGFFHGLGDLLTTGPTLTNVNDFRAIVIDS